MYQVQDCRGSSALSPGGLGQDEDRRQAGDQPKHLSETPWGAHHRLRPLLTQTGKRAAHPKKKCQIGSRYKGSHTSPEQTY